MWKFLAISYALIATACGAGDLEDYQVVYSSAMLMGEPGTKAPEECSQVGVLLIPERDISLEDRLSGAHVEVFFRALDSQAEKFKANYLVPFEPPDAQTAAATGAEFHARLFVCPD